MAVTVSIPTVLRTVTGGQSKVEATGATVGEVLDAVEAAHPGLKDRILDEDGSIKRFMNLFVDDDDVRYLDGLDTKVADGASLTIFQAVAGGC
jgi:molybdopterin synthase sulfur carrier subunit